MRTAGCSYPVVDYIGSVKKIRSIRSAQMKVEFSVTEWFRQFSHKELEMARLHLTLPIPV
jgi:hypothetical protein